MPSYAPDVPGDADWAEEDWADAAPDEPGPPPSYDPWAAALGNASLLGIGYLMLRRYVLAVVSFVVTITLAILLYATVRSTWFEFVVLAWWVVLVAHAAFLARGGTREGPVLLGRLVTLVVALAVLATVGVLRYDASGIEDDVADARAKGDCVAALDALDRIGPEHRLTDAPLTVRAEKTEEACGHLSKAESRLAVAVSGDTESLQEGFDELSVVLGEFPGHGPMVDKVLDGFLAELSTKKSCRILEVTAFLRERVPTRNALDRSAEVAARTQPLALFGCGEERVAANDWEGARRQFQQVVSEFPGHELTPRAEEGVEKATLTLELNNIRSLLATSPYSPEPAYCSRPAPYSGAPASGPGVNRALMYGSRTGMLPAEWRTDDIQQAALVLCVGDDEYGTAVQTCPYESKLASPYGGYYPDDVTFHKIAVPVKVYELRTGRLVTDSRIEIGGASCPEILHYSSYIADLGPPSDTYVTASEADVRAAFAPLVTRGS